MAKIFLWQMVKLTARDSSRLLLKKLSVFRIDPFLNTKFKDFASIFCGGTFPLGLQLLALFVNFFSSRQFFLKKFLFPEDPPRLFPTIKFQCLYHNKNSRTQNMKHFILFGRFWPIFLRITEFLFDFV